MNVHSVGHGHGQHVKPLETTDSLVIRQRSNLSGTSQPLPVDQPERPSVDPSPDDESEEGQDKLPGVLRNLQAGHFKGVADVRLRINFFEELSALASQQSRSTAQAEVGTLLTTVNEQVDQLVESRLVVLVHQGEEEGRVAGSARLEDSQGIPAIRGTSTLIATTRRPGSACIRSSAGISSRQGRQKLAQKFR